MFGQKIVRLAAGGITVIGAIATSVCLSAGPAAAASYTCVGAPFSTGRYCIAHVFALAPLYEPDGVLYTQLDGNTAVKVTCWYKSNGAFEDHVTWENIDVPITGHVPDAFVNFDNHNPNSNAVALHRC
jgi:hypothetical protein